MQGLRNIPYKASLEALNLHSLERSRLAGNLIEVLKWYRSYNKGDIIKLFKVNNQDIARNSEFKLENFRFRRK